MTTGFTLFFRSNHAELMIRAQIGVRLHYNNIPPRGSISRALTVRLLALPSHSSGMLPLLPNTGKQSVQGWFRAADPFLISSSCLESQFLGAR